MIIGPKIIYIFVYSMLERVLFKIEKCSRINDL